MTSKKIISTVALVLMLSAGVAAAQTTYPTTNTGTGQTDTGMMNATTTTPTGSTNTGTTGSTDTTGTGSSTVPGTPNTGAGGDAASTLVTMIASAFAALVGVAYLVTRKPLTR